MLEKVEALSVLLDSVPSPSGETHVPLTACHGRTLSQDIASDIDVPPFNRSAMDGYAVRGADVASTPKELDVLEVIAAGVTPTRSVGAGQCSKIMTGAPLPDGADAVVMVEHTHELSEKRVRIDKGVGAGANVARCGEDVRLGEVVLKQGTVIRPLEVGMLATLGIAEVPVYPELRVAVIATGDELLEPGRGVPGPGQIRESNGTMLAALVDSVGSVHGEYLGIARDERDDVRRMIEKGLAYDVMVFSGGVSMGDYDFVHEELKARGLEVAIEKVAIKPGKPLIFGRLPRPSGGSSFVFGLPGNPVSSFVTFELFVRPFLRAWCGRGTPHSVVLNAEVSHPLRGKAIGRTQHIPAVLTPDAGKLTVRGTEWHGSGDLRGLLDANALIVVEKGVAPPDVGAMAQVHVLEPEMLRGLPRASRG